MYLIGSLTLLFLCFNANPLVSSKKLIVFLCHLECGTKRSISQGAGFDVYDNINGNIWYYGVTN